MADVTRRPLLAAMQMLAAAGPATMLMLAAAGPAATDAYGFTLRAIDGASLPLSQFRGRVLLVVNTASFCGFTPQYKALEALYARLAPAGLTVLGVPSQDFNQEYGANAQVAAFCKATFHVTFPMAGISRVTGGDALPFYRWVQATRGGWQPSWNFCKVLIGRDGRIRGTYASKDTPDGPALQAAIASALRA